MGPGPEIRSVTPSPASSDGGRLSTKKKKRSSNVGGRPRIRSGDEVQVTVEFPLVDYARLSAYVSHKKEEAQSQGDQIWENSKKQVLLGLWQGFWEEIPSDVRRKIEGSDAFRKVVQRSAV